MPEKTDIYQLAGIIGINRQGNKRIEYLAVTHYNKAERGGNAQNGNTQNLLYYLQSQEQIGTSLNLEKVEIYRMYRIPHHAEAYNLQELSAEVPLPPQYNVHKRLGDG